MAAETTTTSPRSELEVVVAVGVTVGKAAVLESHGGQGVNVK